MLRVALSMSRAYYSSELKALKEGQKLKARGGNQPFCYGILIKH